jgi:hypothetical protein
MAEETPILKSSVNFDFSEKELVDVVEKAKDWAMMHGACMRLKSKFDSDSLFVSRKVGYIYDKVQSPSPSNFFAD